jgi:hypothetical protein
MVHVIQHLDTLKFLQQHTILLKRLNILNKTDTEFHICKCLSDASPIQNYLKLYYLLQTLSKFPLEHSIILVKKGKVHPRTGHEGPQRQ